MIYITYFKFYVYVIFYCMILYYYIYILSLSYESLISFGRATRLLEDGICGVAEDLRLVPEQHSQDQQVELRGPLQTQYKRDAKDITYNKYKHKMK